MRESTPPADTPDASGTGAPAIDTSRGEPAGETLDTPSGGTAIPMIRAEDVFRRWPYFGLLVLTFLIWSNSFIAVRALVGDEVPQAERLGAVQFVLVRFAPVAVFCIAWTLLVPRARREALALLRGHWPLVLAVAALNTWGYNLAFAQGHSLVPAGTGSLIITLNPVLTFVFAVALRQERATWLRAAGMAIAFGGIYVVVAYGAGRTVTGAYISDALVLMLAPVCWATYTVLAKRLLVRPIQPVNFTFLALGLGSLPALLGVGFDADLHERIAVWSTERYVAAAFISLGCSVIAFGLWFTALRRLTATSAAVFVFLNPPLTVMFEMLWFGHTPGVGLIGGGALVCVGVAMVLRRRRPAVPNPSGARGA